MGNPQPFEIFCVWSRRVVHIRFPPKKNQNNYIDDNNRHRHDGNLYKLSRAWKTTIIGIKSKTQQGKQITRNASLSLIQDWKHKNTRQKHDIC